MELDPSMLDLFGGNRRRRVVVKSLEEWQDLFLSLGERAVIREHPEQI
jgi:hypothetical protein